VCMDINECDLIPFYVFLIDLNYSYKTD